MTGEKPGAHSNAVCWSCDAEGVGPGCCFYFYDKAGKQSHLE